MKTMMKRTVAGALAALSLMAVSLSVASADKREWQRPTQQDGHSCVLDFENDPVVAVDEDDTPTYEKRVWQRPTQQDGHSCVLDFENDPVVKVETVVPEL